MSYGQRELYGPKAAVWRMAQTELYAVWLKGSCMAQRQLYGVWSKGSCMAYGPKRAVRPHKHSCCEKSKTLTLVARQGMKISLFSTEFVTNSWKAPSQICKLRYFQALSR